MFIVKHKKIFISISATLVLLSLGALFFFGLHVGIDFKGGALTEVVYKTARPPQVEMTNTIHSISSTNFGSVVIQPTGDLGYIVRSRDLTDAEHAQLLNILSNDGKNELTETSFNSIGPSVGRELGRKAILAVILISLVIICFIAFAFRRVSKPISSWKYGLIAIITLLHDVIIPVGIFATLSYFYGAELDSLFVVAVLTILGLSLSDTIVIFDRIRENIKNENKDARESFSEIVGKSLDQSYTRSISTSLSTILVLSALFFFGPSTTKIFALMLAAGMFFGTYSSIFLASPLLVLAEEWQTRK